MTTTPPPDDLWGSILRAVSSKRSTPSRQILLLGDHNAGRSTIAAALLNKQLNSDPNDFALGYDWADVRDDADEGVCASRLP
jgi:dynein light intermediate chain 1, cytosolic